LPAHIQGRINLLLAARNYIEELKYFQVLLFGYLDIRVRYDKGLQNGYDIKIGVKFLTPIFF